MTDNSATMDRLPEDSLATLEMDLAELVRGSDLRYLLDAIGDLYYGHLWLDLAERAPAGETFPDWITATPEQDLWVQYAEIGSPNRLRLLGRLRYLEKVLAVMVAVAGPPTAYVHIVKEWRETEKIEEEIKELRFKNRRQEMEQIEQKAEPVPFDPFRVEISLTPRARDLGSKVSSEALAHKEKMDKEILENATYLFTSVAFNPKLTVYSKTK